MLMGVRAASAARAATRGTAPEGAAEGGDRAKLAETAASAEAMAPAAVMAGSVTPPCSGTRTPRPWRTRHHRSSPKVSRPGGRRRSPAPWRQRRAHPCSTTLRTARQRSGCHQSCRCKTPRGRTGRRQSSRRSWPGDPNCPHQAQSKRCLGSRRRSPGTPSLHTLCSTWAQAKGGSHVSMARLVGGTGAGQAPRDHERCPHCHHALLVCRSSSRRRRMAEVAESDHASANRRTTVGVKTGHQATL